MEYKSFCLYLRNNQKLALYKQLLQNQEMIEEENFDFTSGR